MSGAVTLGCTKKRKKTDTKPQVQKNKCYNEKRRREQENHFIEDLADLIISTSFTSMNTLSAVKPDKCAILQETVNQIRFIKEQERSRTSHLEQSSPQGALTNAVQQGEVSSSRPTDTLTHELAPLVLEAIEGFLLIVSKDRLIEQCSKNIEKYTKFTQEEVLHKDLFNFIHLGDTARFSAILKPPMSVGWPGEETDTSNTSRSFTCRFLVKPPDDREATLDERQQRIDKYEQMQVCSTEVKYPPKDENAETCLMCIARRIPHTEKAKVVSGGGTTILEQFATKLDVDGKIVSIDTSTVSATYAQYINKDLIGNIIQELCPPNEIPKLNAHLDEVIQTGEPVTSTFRLRFPNAPNKYVNIQSTSKLFNNNIMSTHFIIGISELDELDSGTGETGTGSVGSVTPIGDPVMASVMNGTTHSSVTSGVSTSSTSNPSMLNDIFNTSDDYPFSFTTSSWEDIAGLGETYSRPDSRHSATITPVSTPTPRPPSSSPCGSNVQPCVPSPLHQSSYNTQTQPSPAPSQHSTGNTPYGGGFSTLDDVNTPYKIDEQSHSNSSNNNKDTNLLDVSLNESARLRTLLTKKSSDSQQATSPTVSSKDDDTRNKHLILKGLLNQDDDDESKHDTKMSPRGGGLNSGGGLGMSSSHQNQEQPKVSSGNNHMLLKLLNDKSDDDDSEARGGGHKKQSELLQELLKGHDDNQKPVHTDSSSQDDLLLRNLGFTNSPTSPSRKRPSEDGDDHQNKRLSDGTQVSSSVTVGSSKLSQKNKMLASLLAKQPSTTTHIPPLPAHIITATPQEVSRVVAGTEMRKRVGEMGYFFNNDNTYKTTLSTNSTTTTSATIRSRGGVNRAPANTTGYLNQILTNSTQSLNNNNNNNNNDLVNQRVPTSSIRNAVDMNQQYSNATGVGVPTRNSVNINNSVSECVGDAWDTQNDKMLSDILDQVIDIVPDAYVTGNTTLMNMINELDSPQNNNRDVNATMAINAIQQSLMQCENAVKSPSSPVMTLPPGTPPAYSAPSSVVMTSTNQTGFPPPPGYPQRPLRFPGRNPQYPMAGGNLAQQQILLQRNKLHQEQQKRRLLQQQSQQQLLIPSNATAELNSGITNIDSLLNNTVAPNVSLQRSSSVPDSQLSPGYNMSPGQRLQQPYSPNYTQANQFQTVGGSRHSPLPTRSGNSFTNAVAPQTPQPQSQQQVNWGSPTQQARLGLSQQQNPMLNAQLTGANYQNRSFANVQRGSSGQINPSQRSGSVGGMVGSPGNPTANSRQSPFPTSESYQTTGPPGGNSPTATAPSYNNYQQQQLQHRLQRTASAPAPTATTHLPGGLGSPRHHYTHPNPHQMNPQSHPPPQHMGPPYPHTGQQGYDSVQYCYDQSSLQLAYNGADRGRAPPTQGGGTTGNNMTGTSEFVRQELRAVVGARTGQQGTANTQQQSQHNRVPPTQQNTMQLPGGQQVSTSDLEALGLAYEMAPTGGASDSPKLWGTMGSNDIGSMSPQASGNLSSSSRTTMDETRQGDQKSSLLQKLLSE